MVKRKIARLEEDLKRARKEINKLAIENKSQVRGDICSEGVKGSLRLMNEFQLEKKRLEEEVAFYRNRNHQLENSLRDKEPERINTMEGINFMGTKMLVEVEGFDKKVRNEFKQVEGLLGNTDINTRLGVEKHLDAVAEEISELKKNVENSIVLNNFNLTTSVRK